MEPQGSAQASDDPGPLLTMHAALVFVAAIVMGGIIGFLTLASTGSSAPVFHRLVGH
ncbi:hypothetical protein [Streptomyces sp. Wb2n-11]|uniref:hypothetical protein n=1 Tax=Streptomyces sp. Wb2n-11 TaxID=1030533 RepID=UPI000B1AA224|nr:hypothetical protein [Streptomyces sp. Wb2n-11]